MRLFGTHEVAARILSIPVEIAGGSTYAIHVKMASGSVAGVGRIAWLDRAGHEVAYKEAPLIPGEETWWESSAPVSAGLATVGIATAAGELFLREVRLEPVGPRVLVPAVYTQPPVIQWEEMGEVRCDVKNAGSEPLLNPVVELRQGRELLAQGVEPVKTLPLLKAGETITISWPMAVRDPGVFGVQARVRAGGVSAERGGNAVITDEPIRANSEVGGLKARRSHVTMGTRTFRMTLPRLEYGFGTGQLDFGDPFRFGGWIRSAGAAFGDPADPPRLLFGRRTRVAGTDLTLYNSDPLAEWEITLRPAADRHCVTVNTRYLAIKPHVVRSLEGICLCFSDSEGPVETWLDENSCAAAITRGSRKYAAAIRWTQPGIEAAPGVLRHGWLAARFLPSHEKLAAGRQLQWQHEFWVGPFDQLLAGAFK